MVNLYDFNFQEKLSRFYIKKAQKENFFGLLSYCIKIILR